MADKAKIPVVEADASVAQMMELLLHKAGCEVRVAHTGESGMKLVRETKFDLITLDIDLPGLGGFDLCRELKQRHISRRTPVVMISGRAGESERRQALELGAADYTTKPFAVDDFATRILTHTPKRG